VAGFGVVTGGARGIGLATVRTLLAQGVCDEIAVLDRTPAELSEAKVYECDVTDEEAVRSVAESIGRVPDVLVNNAGGTGLDPDHPGATPFDTFMPVAMWRRDIEVNLTSVYIVTRQFARDMAPGSVICNTASIGGVQPGALHAYGTAKSGVIALTRNMAKLLAPRKIRVNAVAPGMIHTDLWKQAAPTHEAFVELIGDAIPLGVDQTPEEIADAIVFLCSDRARQITGQVIAVDGGQSNRPI
jgi:NAD(P)-dependent dehydrogenase (short-subunit alcohol dehydrogenase family)